MPRFPLIEQASNKISRKLFKQTVSGHVCFRLVLFKLSLAMFSFAWAPSNCVWPPFLSPRPLQTVYLYVFFRLGPFKLSLGTFSFAQDPSNCLWPRFLSPRPLLILIRLSIRKLMHFLSVYKLQSPLTVIKSQWIKKSVMHCLELLLTIKNVHSHLYILFSY